MNLNRPQIALGALAFFALLLAYGLPALKGGTGLIARALQRLKELLFRKGPAIAVAGERLTDQDRLRHTHILGSTGSGKTVLLENLIYEDLNRGYGMFIIDPKGDRELYDRIKSFCAMIGRSEDLHLISANYPKESVRWNPCRLGAPSELQTKLLNSWEFSEVYYAKACEAALLEALNNIRSGPYSLADLVSALQSISERKKEDAAKALFLDLFSTTQGEWGEILCSSPPADTLREVSLLDIIRKNEILFVDLPTEGRSVQSSRIGKLFLQELMLISGMRKTYPHLRTKTPFSVYVDEFDAFATPSFATFLNKGRSSGFMIHICHQTLSDLMRVDNGVGSFLGQVQGNVNNRFFFRIDDPKDAETISSFFGTRLAKAVTSRVQEGQETGDGSIRETYEFRIHPDTIKELKVGECIYSSKTAGRLMKLAISMPNPTGYSRKMPLIRPPQITVLKKDRCAPDESQRKKPNSKKENTTCAT